jgi:predicted transcriptional regulator
MITLIKGILTGNRAMTINQSDLNNFHQFATDVLARAGQELELEDLMRQWLAERDRAATVDSIRRGVADAEAGRVHDLADVDAGIREKLSFPARR